MREREQLALNALASKQALQDRHRQDQLKRLLSMAEGLENKTFAFISPTYLGSRLAFQDFVSLFPDPKLATFFQHNLQIKLTNGSTIFFKSTDKAPETLLGLHAVEIDELD